MPKFKLKVFVTFLALICLIITISKTQQMEAQAANCRILPNVSWWKASHQEIIKFVEENYDGKWEPYIKKWQIYLVKMKSILKNNGTAIVKPKGLRLRGEKLRKHIDDVETRIQITRCLKEKHGSRFASYEDENDMGLKLKTSNILATYVAAKRKIIDFAKLSFSTYSY
ncbi:MAG: hypothetical protein VX617_03100 [Pseudomonadota bacterium]|nr:hypothetical protein [Pseudomonadota bacterium]